MLAIDFVCSYVYAYDSRCVGSCLLWVVEFGVVGWVMLDYIGAIRGCFACVWLFCVDLSLLCWVILVFLWF